MTISHTNSYLKLILGSMNWQYKLMKLTYLIKSVTRLIKFGHIIISAYWISPVSNFEVTVVYWVDTPANVLCYHSYEDSPTSYDHQYTVHHHDGGKHCMRV